MSAPIPRERHWLSQAQAADELGVTDRTIRSYVARGVLPAKRIQGSRLVRIHINDLNGLLLDIPTVGADHVA